MSMICAKCGEPMTCPWDAGLYEETCVGYISPPGHDHNRNCRTRTYQCKLGHVRKISVRRTCHACDWKGPETCFCHDGPKLDRWPEEQP